MALPAHQPVEIEKYELLEELGHGGMATVYRARDRRLGREVAVKVIHRHLRESPEVGARFRSEALAVAKVKHPNIVEVYDVSGEEEDEKYLVVELIRGVTLRQLLRERGPAPPEIAACLAVEVTRALAVAHSEGVVHRDIKPENVLIGIDQTPRARNGSEKARVKLTDFGIAKLLDAQGVTHTGQVLGSPAHMAPEQIEGGDVDARADVFGTGVLLYELLTGVLPFEGSNPAQVLRKVLEGVFLPAERQRPRVGSSYGTIVQQALAQLPEDRFASASDMASALEAELASVGVTDVRDEISRYLDEPEQYNLDHERNLPKRLSECASSARKNGEMVRAAALFNRALAYRPDDTHLLAEVAGLARRDRMRRRVASASVVGLIGLALLGGAAWFLSSDNEAPQRAILGNQSESVAKTKKKAQPKDTTTPEPRALEVAKKVKTEIQPERPALDVVQSKRKPRAPTLTRPPRTVPQGTRQVRTPVVGPQNADVRIDGRQFKWYQLHNLSYGPHTFEFVPPNRECCEASAPRTIDIVPGEGEQTVRGVIKFRPGTLRLSAPDGSKASCGIGSVIVAGGSRSIPMNRPKRRLSCTIFPPPNTGGEPKQIDVELRPGQTFTLSSR